jgi:hypothetical protein
MKQFREFHLSFVLHHKIGPIFVTTFFTAFQTTSGNQEVPVTPVGFPPPTCSISIALSSRTVPPSLVFMARLLSLSRITTTATVSVYLLPDMRKQNARSSLTRNYKHFHEPILGPVV